MLLKNVDCFLNSILTVSSVKFWDVCCFKGRILHIKNRHHSRLNFILSKYKLLILQEVFI